MWNENDDLLLLKLYFLFILTPLRKISSLASFAGTDIKDSDIKKGLLILRPA